MNIQFHWMGYEALLSYSLCFTMFFLGISRDVIQLPALVSSIAISGVDLFFVLSGFLIGGIIIDEHKNRRFWKSFVLRRIGRIFPVYFLIIGSFSITMLLLPNRGFLDDFSLINPLPIAPYFVFLQSYFQGIANTAGPYWVAMTWTLSVEEQFYIILPLVAMLFGRKGIMLAIFIAIVAAPFIRHWAGAEFGFYAGYMLFPSRMDSLAMGVVVAFTVRNDKLFSFFSKSKLLYVIAFILFFYLKEKVRIGGFLIDYYHFRAMFYASIVLIVITKKNILITWVFENKVIVFFGSISYGLYIYHQLMNGLLHSILNNRAPKIDSMDSFAIAIFVFLVSIGVSAVSRKYFEFPIRNYFKHKANALTDSSLKETR